MKKTLLKEKKAIARENLVKLIIVILSAALLILILGKFSPLFGKTINAETCRDSVLLRAGVIERIGIFGQVTSLPPLRCETEYYCLTAGGECPEKYTKIKVKDDADIKEKIADYMYECWWQSGEGKRIFIRYLFQSPEECMICSSIVFGNDIQGKYTDIKDLNLFLAERVIPDKDATYAKYITLGKIEQIKTNEKYLIVFQQKLKTEALSEIEKSSISIVSVDEGLQQIKCKDPKSIP